MAMLGDGDAVLVCDVTESSFEVTAVRAGGRPAGAARGPDRDPERRREADRAGTPAPLTVIGSATVRRAGCGQATSPARSVGPCSTRACRASRSSTSSCPGRPRASGGSSRRPRRRADSTGCWRCPHSAARGAAHLAVAAAPAPPTGYSGDPAERQTEYAGGAPVPAGDDARLVPPPAHPAAGPLPAGAPWLPPPAAPPRPRRAGRAGAGRAGVVAVVLVVAVVIAAAVLFAPSLLTLRSADARPAGASGGRGARTEPR